jgi:hypothetical protein
MARINDRLLVQRADDVIVISDESAGQEIVFSPEVAGSVVAALQYFINSFKGV